MESSSNGLTLVQSSKLVEQGRHYKLVLIAW